MPGSPLVLQDLLPTGPVLGPALLAFVLYGGRYLLFAALASAVAWPAQGGAGRWTVLRRALWGRPHDRAPAQLDASRHARREIGWSLLSLAVFAAVNAVLFGWGWLKHSQVYVKFSAYPVWWFWLSIPVLLVLHDALFYALHRAMHHRWLFNTMHRVHHRSTHPTGFAAYSFHPTEALGEVLIVTALIFILPVHPLAMLIFQTISTAYNVYGHCGREFYPPGMRRHWLGRWLNTSTAHAIHHGTGRHNYSLYFTWWDHWLGTVDPGLTRPPPPAPGSSTTARPALHG